MSMDGSSVLGFCGYAIDRLKQAVEVYKSMAARGDDEDGTADELKEKEKGLEIFEKSSAEKKIGKERAEGKGRKRCWDS